MRKLPVTWGYAMVFVGYSGFLHYLQLASHELATISINVTRKKIPNSRHSLFFQFSETQYYTSRCKLDKVYKHDIWASFVFDNGCIVYLAQLQFLIQNVPQGSHIMVCNRNWHLSGNTKPVWHTARLIKEGGCVDLFMDTLHLKDPMVLFGSEGSALTLPLLLLSP